MEACAPMIGSLLLPSILPVAEARLGVGRCESTEGRERDHVSPFGGQDGRGVVSKPGVGRKEGWEPTKPGQ